MHDGFKVPSFKEWGLLLLLLGSLQLESNTHLVHSLALSMPLWVRCTEQSGDPSKVCLACCWSLLTMTITRCPGTYGGLLRGLLCRRLVPVRSSIEKIKLQRAAAVATGTQRMSPASTLPSAPRLQLQHLCTASSCALDKEHNSLPLSDRCQDRHLIRIPATSGDKLPSPPQPLRPASRAQPAAAPLRAGRSGLPL